VSEPNVGPSNSYLEGPTPFEREMSSEKIKEVL